MNSKSDGQTCCTITYDDRAGNDGGHFLMDARPVCEKCSTVGVGRVVAQPRRPFAKYFKTSGMISIFVTGAFSFSQV